MTERLRSTAIVCPPTGLAFAATPLTAENAALILNALPVTEPAADSYLVTNVINPDNTLCLAGGRFAPAEGRHNHPVTGVTFHGASIIARAVGARLPTVAEWQRLVRLHGTRYPWGNEPPAPEGANFDEHHGGTTDVHSFPPSGLGLHDLLGNVGEWCATDGLAQDEAAVVGGGWNKPIEPDWRQPRYKWKRIGTVAIGMRLAFEAR